MSTSWINHDKYEIRIDREEAWYMTKRNDRILCDHIGFQCVLKSNVTNPLPLMFCISKDFVGYSGYSYITYYITSYLINLRFIRGSKRPTIFHPLIFVPRHSTNLDPFTSIPFLEVGLESAKLWFCTHLTGTDNTKCEQMTWTSCMLY